MKLFVLPCCPFKFYGKLRGRTSGESHYREFLNYVKIVGQKCGLVMEEDRLKIVRTFDQLF